MNDEIQNQDPASPPVIVIDEENIEPLAFTKDVAFPVVKFAKIHPDAVIPKRATKGSAGMDLRAVSFEKKDFCVIAHTGLKMQLPEGYEAQIRSRSGLATQGCVVLNSPGTVDSDYRGEVCVILGSTNGSPCYFPGTSVKTIKISNTELNVGDRVAQMVIAKVADLDSEEVDSIDNATERGDGGFGSTGVK